MQIPHLLLKTLDDIVDADLKTFQWFLKTGAMQGCISIPMSHLEKASRTDTVSKMIQFYGEKTAVDITIHILEKMNNYNAAGNLKKEYAAAGGTTATSSSSSPSSSSSSSVPAATIVAQSGATVIAPMLSGSTSGDFNFAVNK